MRRIITVQHPQSEQHVNKMIGSWGAWDLTEQGVRQAENIAGNLCDEIKGETYVLYSSDLLRTQHTAQIIGNRLQIQPHYSALLREFDLGEAKGKSKQWAREHVNCPVWPGTIDWAADADGRVFRGAESRREVWNRVAAFFAQVIEPAKEDLIIVSHDGTLSLIFAMWLGLDLDMLNKCMLCGKAGGVSVLCEDDNGNRRIARLNDMSFAEKQKERF